MPQECFNSPVSPISDINPRTVVNKISSMALNISRSMPKPSTHQKRVTMNCHQLQRYFKSPASFVLIFLQDCSAYLVGGSIPERKGAQLFNTSLTFSPTGKLLAVHRKVHLFDIDVPGKIRFQESEVLTGGQTLTDFETEYGKFGLAICYDVRFPEMAMIAARKGAVAMIYPGAFNLMYNHCCLTLTAKHGAASLGASRAREGCRQPNLCSPVLSGARLEFYLSCVGPFDHRGSRRRNHCPSG